jgi:hypothetical protein
MQSEADGQLAVTTYARLSTREQAAASDLTDYWEDPVSYFLTQVRASTSQTGTVGVHGCWSTWHAWAFAAAQRPPLLAPRPYLRATCSGPPKSVTGPRVVAALSNA